MQSVEQRIKSAKKLQADIRTKLNNWNERSQFTLKGVKNLSRSDMDMLNLYADNIIRRGTYQPMTVFGYTKEVMKQYNLIED